MTTPEKPGEATGTASSADEKQVVKVKKYANRRLYNTATSSYVTLDDLSQMVKEGIEFVVHDAKTGDDITRAVLTQIIVEEESKGGQNLLPIGFLRQLIGFYGDNLQAVVPRYLEASMQAFARNQQQFRDSMQAAFGGFFPFGGQLEELSKQNMQLFQSAMNQMWAPFNAQRAEDASGTAKPAPADKQAAGRSPADDQAAIDEMKRQMALMQRRLDELSKK
jgi:polyhydroxyalkanoate synthesis repressor PhaR